MLGFGVWGFGYRPSVQMLGVGEDSAYPEPPKAVNSGIYLKLY